MSTTPRRGLTLIELLIATAIMAMLATAVTTLVSACMQAQQHSTDTTQLYREGLLLMETMVSRVRTTTHVQVPNSHDPTRPMLIVSDNMNEDNDFYFGDPLFPRVDEDLGTAMLGWGYGIYGVDDDGDGGADNGANRPDDDEDGQLNEDPLNGIDDDADGTVDEDYGADIQSDSAPGVAGMDDDGDGAVDEPDGGDNDDDEDGRVDEEDITTVMYTFDAAKGTLTEIHPDPFSGTYSPRSSQVLARNIKAFEVTYVEPGLITITMAIENESKEKVIFEETVRALNVLQRTGKRVR